jgi:L-ribulokinase
LTIVAGIDFGTASVRVSIVDSDRGRLGSGAAAYVTRRDSKDPDFATQSHEDHCRALESAFGHALADAVVAGAEITALALATTGSTTICVDAEMRPLGDYYLWCDHRAWREAAEITEKARACNLPALEWCGGTYSSEWGFAKVLHWLRHNASERERFHTAFEHCDFMVATLTGVRRPEDVARSVCAMGHKWMWNAALGGLPPEAFLASVDPLLAGLRQRLAGQFRTSDAIAGELCPEWAARLGLRAGIPIPVGGLDAHWDAIGSGCRLGDIVNVIGTSTCVMALSEHLQPVPGVSGVVQGSIHPGKAGIEAGLSAVGDLFEAIARRANTTVSALSADLGLYRAGQTGLTRLAWDNGDRSVLADPRLRGVTLGWRLNHTAADELFAAIEGSAFHTRIILDRLTEYGAPIERLINGGGIPQRNETLNRVYAGIVGKPVLVPAQDATSLGSAIFALLAAGAFRSVEEAQDKLCPSYRVVEPEAQESTIYDDLYGHFRELYFLLGERWPGFVSRSNFADSEEFLRTGQAAIA